MTNLAQKSVQSNNEANFSASVATSEMPKYSTEQRERLSQAFLEIFDGQSLIGLREDLIHIFLNLQKMESFFGDRQNKDITSIDYAPSVLLILNFLGESESILSGQDDFEV